MSAIYSPNGLPMVNGESPRIELRHSPGSLNGGTSFDVITPPSSGQRTPADLSYVNPMGMGQISMTDVTLEQALERVQELMKENKDLRDYMKENNEMMRQQYEALAEYKTRVQESNAQNKDKFEQTRNVILELKKENTKLRSSLQSQADEANLALTEKLTDQERTTTKLKEENSVKDQEIGILRHQLKELSLHNQSNQGRESDVVFVANTKEDEERLRKAESERDSHAKEVETLTLKRQADKEEISKLKTDLNMNKRVQDEYDMLSLENLELSNKLRAMINENKTLKAEIKKKKLEVADLMSSMEELSKKNQENEELLKSAGYTLMEGSPKPGDRWEFPSREEDQRQRQGMRVATPSEVMVQIQDNSKVEQLQRQLSQKERQMDELVMELHQKDQELLHLRDTNSKQVQSPTYTGDVQSLMSQNMALMSEIKETSVKLESAKLAVEKKANRIAELEERLKVHDGFMSQRDEDNAIMESLRMSLKGFEEALNAERREHQNTKKQLMELKQTFNNLTADYKSILQNFESFKENSLKQQKMSIDPCEKQRLLDKISQLTAEMVSGEEAGKYRDSQMKRMKEDIEKLKIDNETIPVLRAQADVWKQDFDAERNSRERQHAENQQLRQEVHSLQLQNQQLMDELETLSKGQFAEMQRKHVGAGSHQQQMQNYLQVGGSPTPVVHRPPIQYPYQENINVTPPAPHTQQQPAHRYVNYPYPTQQYPGGVEAHQAQSMSRGSGSQQEDNDYQPYCCPKCNAQCPDVDTLQIHVLDCIDH
ncbi:NF-kappa-B essential modulator-like [Ylistrum balloti]|uniref:NF-kappa-B essential modulator-like n=1 Tax=Ylistrum balloti TaxID=509963 RepID=UPI002905DC4A|nr:NF-kappa-B essential modulator-like [Ylistrum balloti]XP_060079018.1 NF-kappa-B essential modulator-like [Ylistrum balloti]